MIEYDGFIFNPKDVSAISYDFNGPRVTWRGAHNFEYTGKREGLNILFKSGKNIKLYSRILPCYGDMLRKEIIELKNDIISKM